MTQAQLDYAVARATGESLRTVRSLGFGQADPKVVCFDPEPLLGRPQSIDGDAPDRQPARTLAGL
jgi:hypothetical protein